MILFVTGIDTGIGKTDAVGWLAAGLLRQGLRLTTMKLAETGCTGESGDVQRHRLWMGAAWDEWDRRGLTCPQRFRFPASPHLAARLENREVDLAAIDRASAELCRHFPLILLEGVGGIEVPLKGATTVLDFVAERRYPTLVVTSPRLGSINHTLLTVKALAGRQVEVRGLIYNLHGAEQPEITADTRRVLRELLPEIPAVDMPSLAPGAPLVPPDPRWLREICRDAL